MTTAYSTINASLKHPLEEKDLAHFIKAEEFPDKYKEHIHIFFTEVSTSVIYRFIMEQGITLQQLKEYYLKYIKGKYTNNNLEDMFTVE